MTVQLLVSVRNLHEAAAALNGGADIIDVKEPLHGSLGAATAGVIEEIIQFVRGGPSGTTVSAAMGEVVDQLQQAHAPAADLHSVAAQLDFVKCGLSRLQTDKDTTGWKRSWNRFRNNYTPPAMNCRWVAVSYADFERSQSPSPTEIMDEGRAIGSPILLIDTFMKDGTTLLDWLTVTQLRQLRDSTRVSGMQLALAGRISAELLPAICECVPDIIAIRGAACEQGDREATVTAERVRSFRSQLNCLLPVA
jgi:(5-formylfuran-3-yl)methyl phosphate synthase